MAVAETRQQRALQRTVAARVSVLMAELCVSEQLELDTALSYVRSALDKTYWGDLPQGGQGAITHV